VGDSIGSARVRGENRGAGATKTVANILEHQLDGVIQHWLARDEKEPDLTAVPLNFQERTCHLPQLLRDVIRRLRLDTRRSSHFGGRVPPRRLAESTRLHRQ